MRLKNYQEDLVLNLIGLVLEDNSEIEADETFIHDVAAYTLNRIPPKYISSERGFTRFASANVISDSNGDGLVNLIELLIVINKGISYVQSRRRLPMMVAAEHGGGFLQEPEQTIYIHNYPQFIGRVLDEESRKPVYRACVTMFIDGEKASPADSGWINPYYTGKPTKGFYSFWPQPLEAESESKASTVRITIEHPDYELFEFEQELTTEGSFVRRDTIDGDAVYELEPSYIKKNSTHT